jgi:hypothetical protein
VHIESKRLYIARSDIATAFSSVAVNLVATMF